VSQPCNGPVSVLLPVHPAVVVRELDAASVEQLQGDQRVTDFIIATHSLLGMPLA